MQIDAPCLDCGAPIRVEIRDGVVMNSEPAGLMGYVAVPFKKWFEDIPFA
ncbi:MAG: hypothetical protein JSV31_21715 [Desulfobacterales bacterium]|nr:MAG: hypothetical protein JSV31_21715 [Desulfobacterales bacterium]